MDFLERLTEIVGKENITASPVDCLAYSRDMSIHAAVPHAIVFAESTEQVGKIVALANTEKVPVTARGTGSSVTGAVLAAKGGVILDFTRMNSVKEINAADGYAVVEPGVICNALNAKLAPSHFFPPDPGSAPIANHRRHDCYERERCTGGQVRNHERLCEGSHRGDGRWSDHSYGGHRSEEFCGV